MPLKDRLIVATTMLFVGLFFLLFHGFRELVTFTNALHLEAKLRVVSQEELVIVTVVVIATHNTFESPTVDLTHEGRIFRMAYRKDEQRQM